MQSPDFPVQAQAIPEVSPVRVSHLAAQLLAAEFSGSRDRLAEIAKVLVACEYFDLRDLVCCDDVAQQPTISAALSGTELCCLSKLAGRVTFESAILRRRKISQPGGAAAVALLGKRPNVAISIESSVFDIFEAAARSGHPCVEGVGGSGLRPSPLWLPCD